MVRRSFSSSSALGRVVAENSAGPVARIGVAADAEANPLLNVAAEMQHQVADGVLVRVVAAPNLFVGQLTQAEGDRGGHLLQLADGIVEEEFRDGRHLHLQ